MLLEKMVPVDLPDTGLPPMVSLSTTSHQEEQGGRLLVWAPGSLGTEESGYADSELTCLRSKVTLACFPRVPRPRSERVDGNPWVEALLMASRRK